MVNLEGIGDKLVDNTDKIAGALTFISLNGIGHIQNVINAVLANPPTIHMPDIRLTMGDVVNNSQVVSTALLALGAYVLKEAGVPYMSKVSNVATKAAMGIAAAVGICQLMFRATHGSGGSYGPSTSSGTVAEGVRSALQTPQGPSYDTAPAKTTDPNISPDFDVFAE